MARVGTISIGGKEKSTNQNKFESGVVFSLKSYCKFDQLFNFQNEWEVEVKTGHQSIVARCQHQLSVDKILSRGMELCQQALDLISVERKGEMQIEAPGVEHIILFKDSNKIIIRQVSLAEFPMSMTATITKTDKDGNVIPDPPPPKINWIPAFRFYRLSQGNSDLFEAYRNLFLGLESLLNQICPKSVNEGEKEWLRRALRLISNKIPLYNFVPIGTKKPIDYFIKNQYDNIRCKLFHAKGHRVILPHQSINPAVVVDAYDNLIKLWRQISTVYFNISGGGGVITYQGFRLMMDAAFKNGFTFIASDDDTPPKDSDTEVSPLNKELYPYDHYKYINNVNPGNVLLIANLGEPGLSKVKAIYRIGVKVEDTLFSIKYLPDGLFLNDIDEFESYQTFRLINKGMPKTIF